MNYLMSFLSVLALFFTLSFATAKNSVEGAEPARRPAQARVDRDKFVQERIEDANNNLIGYRWVDTANKVICYIHTQSNNMACLKQ